MGPRTRGQARSFQSLQASFELDHRAVSMCTKMTVTRHRSWPHAREMKHGETNANQRGAAEATRLEPHALRQGGGEPRPRGQARRATLALAAGGGGDK